MRAVFYADDGKEFDNEEECREYENNTDIKKFQDQIHGKDSCGNIVPLEAWNFGDRITIVKLDTQEAVDYFLDRFNEEGLDSGGIDEPGIYVWGDEYGFNGDYNWVYAEDVLTVKQEELDNLRDTFSFD